MVFYPLFSTRMLVYVAAAVFPAIYLMVYVYKKDRIEKEPIPMLLKLGLMGVCAALASMVLEEIGERIVYSLPLPYNTLLILDNFLVIAGAEEGTKFYFLRRGSWRSPEFNYRFDAIIYAVAVSLGFAAFENILYVLDGGLSVAILRALLSVPGHMCFAVFMGAFYGSARLCQYHGDPSGRSINMALGFIVPVTLHGTYDYCCSLATPEAEQGFLIFVALMFFVAFKMIKRQADSDRPV